MPTTLGSGAASEALNLPCGTGALGIACSGVETVYGLACGGLPTQVPTIEFVTINLENPPAVECPTL
ncbi:MAG TPA: hypothetical protein VHC63_08645 [Acidimicrobiales bacterium]|nr:hypothetical protein [Acidimicrobiales bacterium]